MATAAVPRFALALSRPAASPRRDPRLVVVTLAGGLDGLAAVPPLGDEEVRRIRPDSLSARPLDGVFGLHPAMPALHGLYRRGQALICHGVASSYRGASHAEAIAALHGEVLGQGFQGHLNRGAGDGLRALRLAIGHRLPELLIGPMPVTICDPAVLVSTDSARLTETILRGEGQTRRITAAGFVGPAPSFEAMALATGRLLAEPSAPRLATLTLDGFDTHADQERRLARQLAALDRGLAALAEGLGAAWAESIVLVVSEFGRSLRVNAAGGTDHGRAGTAFILGGGVAGGRIVGDWPGASEADGLQASIDSAALFDAVLREHHGAGEPRLARRDDFSSSHDAKATGGL